MYTAGIWPGEKGVQTVRSDSKEGVAQPRYPIQRERESE